MKNYWQQQPEWRITVAPRIASACAVCGLGPNDVGGHAFNSSVLFMMAVPYTTVALIGGAFYLTWRRAAQRRNAFAHCRGAEILR